MHAQGIVVKLYVVETIFFKDFLGIYIQYLFVFIYLFTAFISFRDQQSNNCIIRSKRKQGNIEQCRNSLPTYFVKTLGNVLCKEMFVQKTLSYSLETAHSVDVEIFE